MSTLTRLPGLVSALFAVLSATLVPCCSGCSDDRNATWSYRGTTNGPRQWGRLFPRDCSGSSQSPIAIESFRCNRKRHLPQLFLQNYDVPIRNATMVNYGYTVQIMPDDNVQRTIVVDGDKYDLDQLHFHWGLRRGEGSEHTINRRAYAMEVHFVHLASDGRVAVVGVFFQEYIIKQNKGLQPIINSLSDVRYKNNRTSLKSPLVLNNLLPKNPASFYRYYGSLTTPNCTEGVIWSVISKPIPVGRSQMKEFRSLFSVTKAKALEGENQDCLIAPNYRPPQSLNGREVFCSK